MVLKYTCNLFLSIRIWLDLSFMLLIRSWFSIIKSVNLWSCSSFFKGIGKNEKYSIEFAINIEIQKKISVKFSFVDLTYIRNFICLKRYIYFPYLSWITLIRQKGMYRKKNYQYDPSVKRIWEFSCYFVYLLYKHAYKISIWGVVLYYLFRKKIISTVQF